MPGNDDKESARADIVKFIIENLHVDENAAAYIEDDEVMDAIAEAMQKEQAFRDDPKRYADELQLAVSQIQIAINRVSARLGS